MPKSTHTAEQKVFIVSCLAQYMVYSEIQTAYEKRFGAEIISTSTIQHYDVRYTWEVNPWRS